MPRNNHEINISDLTDPKDILMTRLLYNAFVQTVLIAWNYGCSVAYPCKDIKYLSRNQYFIFESINNYIAPEYKFSLQPVCNDGLYMKKYHLQYAAIKSVHDAVLISGKIEFTGLAGEKPFDTLKNLIIYFEKQISLNTKR